MHTYATKNNASCVKRACLRRLSSSLCVRSNAQNDRIAIAIAFSHSILSVFIIFMHIYHTLPRINSKRTTKSIGTTHKHFMCIPFVSIRFVSDFCFFFNFFLWRDIYSFVLCMRDVIAWSVQSAMVHMRCSFVLDHKRTHVGGKPPLCACLCASAELRRRIINFQNY